MMFGTGTRVKFPIADDLGCTTQDIINIIYNEVKEHGVAFEPDPFFDAMGGGHLLSSIGDKQFDRTSETYDGDKEDDSRDIEESKESDEYLIKAREKLSDWLVRFREMSKQRGYDIGYAGFFRGEPGESFLEDDLPKMGYKLPFMMSVDRYDWDLINNPLNV